MPNIIVKVPEGAFEGDARKNLAQGLTSVAKSVEQIGDDPRQELLTWVAIEDVRSGSLFAGGADLLSRVIPVIVFFYTPEGIIEPVKNQEVVRLVHEAVAGAKPAGDPRPVMTSVILAPVADGTWGANGSLWRLADFVRTAGYKHLQHLVS